MTMAPFFLPLLLCCALMLLQASTAAKLAFLMPPRSHHHPSQTSLSTLHHSRSTAKIYSSLPPRLLNSRLMAASGSGDDDSICDVYQQVKEEDSEWFSKISQLLGNDEMELLDTSSTCGDDKAAEVTPKSNVKVVNQVKEEASKQVADDSLVGDDQSISKEDAIDEVSTKVASKESPKLESLTDSRVEDDIDESPMIQESTEAPVAGSHSEGHYTQFLDDDNEEEDDMEDFTDNSNKEIKAKVESREAIKEEDIQPKQDQVEDDRVEPEQASPSSIVRIYNEFTKEHENIAPLSALEKLGYNEKELKVLRPQVLELIVDDRIPRPRRGIPKRWVKSKNDDQYDEEEERYDDDFGWQVQVVPRKKTAKRESSGSQNNEQRVNAPKHDTAKAVEERIDNKKDVAPPTTQDDAPPTRRPSEYREDAPSPGVEGYTARAANDKVIDDELNEVDNELKQPRPRQQQQLSSEYEQEFRKERGYRPPPQRRRQPQQPARDDGYDERPNPNTRRRGRGSDRRQRTPKRQELLIDRDSYGDDPSGNKFWMDLPMFKDFLRKEAQFRLKILGPDWKESVMDESRWRYDLYKTWLQAIDEGVGENPLYAYSDQPRQRRRRPRSQSDASYEREADVRAARETDARAAPRRRVPRSQPDVEQRRTVDDEDDYDYEEPRSKRNLDDVEVEQRRRPEQKRTEQRPRRQTRSSQPPRNERWTNFNDLEESLLRSKGEPQGSREEYSHRRSDGDERPRRRRRTADIYEEEEEESDEDETPRRRYSTDAYVDSLEEDKQPQRRRSRARRVMSYEDDEL